MHSAAYRTSLDRFRRGKAELNEARQVVRHLLSGCSDCRTETSRLWPRKNRLGEGRTDSSRERSTGYDYSAVFARAERAVTNHQLRFAEERAVVAGLRQELARHPRSRQQVLAENSTRFHSWAFVESLLDDCRPVCQSEPEEAFHLARLAIHLAGSLDPECYGQQRIRDLQARSWAELANVLRVQEKYCESERAFGQAHEFLANGTGDPVELAGVLSLEASMWNSRFQADRAVALLDRTITISRRLGEGDLWARALIQKATCSSDRGFPEQAVTLLLEAQRHLNPTLDPRLTATVQHNILYALVQAGRFEEAAAGIASTRALHERLDYPVDKIRLTWLEGRVLHGLGRLEEAEACLHEAFDGMLGEGADFKAAMIGLDLAALYTEQNRNAEIRELATAMLPVFTSHRIHREALAALLVFREAVVRERLSTELVQELAEYLRRAAGQPHLRFNPPSAVDTGV